MAINKVVLITGAARRVGAEIAKVLHAAGMNIVLHYNRSAEEAQQLCAKLNADRPDSAALVRGELTEIANLSALVRQAADVWGRLDVLVNNASGFYKTDSTQATEEQWDGLMTCNLKAPYFLCQAAFPYVRANQGSIINITDIHAQRPMQDYAIYSIAKAGLVMLTKALALDYGPAVRVNGVSPGAVIWPEGENTLNEELQQKIIQKTALKRHGSAHDIATAVRYLVLDAEYVTGQVLAVDGGRSLSM